MESRWILAAACGALAFLQGCAVGEPQSAVCVEAESGQTDGVVCGPSRERYAPCAEASSRRSVRLEAKGRYLEVRVPRDCEAVVIRYSLSDVPGGRDERMRLLRNGHLESSVPLTSRLSWVYGDFPWSEDPAEGKPHAFFDEVSVRIPGTRAGDVIRMEKTGRDGFVLLDFLEFERVPPARRRPSGSLSITDYGAVSGDAGDDSPALRACLAAAGRSGRAVWVPPGEFRLDGGAIPLGGVCLRGAGMWHSRLIGRSPYFVGNGRRVKVSDLSICGEVSWRRDASPDNAFHGNFGRGSGFDRLWIEHVKCGFWTTGGTCGMRVTRSRIRNTLADGLNFCNGTSGSEVRRCSLRNTGDDSLATWSPGGGAACRRNAFIRNVIQLPWHASGIALYGGQDHLVRGNLIRGTVYSGAGILVSSGFGSVPFDGTIRIGANRIEDCGGECYLGEQVGGLWVHAKDSAIHPLLSVRGLQIAASPGAAVSIHGPHSVERLVLQNLTITGAGRPDILIHPGASGRLKVRGLASPALVWNRSPGAFAMDGRSR